MTAQAPVIDLADVSSAPLPAGPRGRVLQTMRYLRDPYAYYERAQKRFGRFFLMPTMNGDLLITGTPEGVDELFNLKSRHLLAEFGADSLRPLVGPSSLLLLSGDRHRRERKRLSPSFHGNRMKRAYSDLAQQAVLERASHWRTDAPLNIHREMQRITLEVILRACFGVQQPEEVEAFAEQVTRTVDAVHPLPIFFSGLQREFGGFGPWARFLRERALLDGMLYPWIRSKRRERADGEDILGLMLAAQDGDGAILSDEDVHDQLMTLIAAGHETTATTLSWIFYELHRRPDVLEWLRDAIRGLGPDPTAADLASLPELEAVAHETLRIHPILFEVMRTVKDGLVFQGVEVPAGVHLTAAMPLVHLDPAIYPEPHTFRPQRFLERRYSLCEFFPFGGGHRRCLGAAFALNEIKVVLGTLLMRFDFELAQARPLRPVRRNATMAPEQGVPMRFLGARAA